MDELLRLPPSVLPPEVVAEIQQTAERSRSEATWRIYRRNWRNFEGWCYAKGHRPLQAAPEVVAAYLIERGKQGAGRSDLVQRRAAIAAAYEVAGIAPSPTDSPLIKMVMRALFRERRAQRPRKKAAATEAVLRRMLVTIDRNALQGKRDAALLIVGQIGAFRRGALCRVEVEHLEKDERGYRVMVPWDKTDQEGTETRRKVFPRRGDELCPVRAIEDWLAASGISSGFLFRWVSHGHVLQWPLDGQTVAVIVKRCVRAAGIEGDFSGHSLRAGFVTEAFQHRIPIDRIQAQTFHENIGTLLGYRRVADPYEGNAATDLANRELTRR
jgi:integrase